MRGSVSSITGHRQIVCPRKYWIYLILLVLAVLAAFSRTGIPLLLALYPLLILVLLWRGKAWASILMLFAAGVACWCAVRGQGPFAQAHLLPPGEPFLLLLVFIGTAALLLYSVSMVLDREQETIRQLKKVAALHALVSENSRDAIILADLSGHRRYGSASAESLDGWKPEKLMTEEGLEMVHPEDRARVRAIVHALNSGREGAMIECRIRKRSGEYIWVEASLLVVRDLETGNPSRILNIVRDISERKEAEQKLQQAYNAVEALAVTDELTGLANRRRFDQCLTTEWHRSMRDNEPLSLLMLDVDKFKLYNDTYGHQRGDSCLKQIAESCMDVVSRPGDLVARFGGEEFVVILPNTENEGSTHVANDICEALRSRRLPHKGNLAGIVTISAGCATLIPRFGQRSTDLIEMADQALYKAKHNGRNRVCTSSRIKNAQSYPLPASVASKTA
jgi:diguanylate cyclase (GGDEF)-like protein/PAS domain S-box-containing protein